MACTNILFSCVLCGSVQIEEIVFSNKQCWVLNVCWMQLISVVTVEAEKGLHWIKNLTVWMNCVKFGQGLLPPFDMIRQDCVCVCVCSALMFALSHTWSRTLNPTRLAFRRGGHLLETSAPFSLCWSMYWTVPSISACLSVAWTCSLSSWTGVTKSEHIRTGGVS